MLKNTFNTIEFIDKIFPGKKMFEIFYKALDGEACKINSSDETKKLAVLLKIQIRESIRLLKFMMLKKTRLPNFEQWCRLLIKIKGLHENYQSKLEAIGTHLEYDINHMNVIFEKKQTSYRAQNQDGVQLLFKCNTPAFTFRGLQEADPRSILFASGTLKPMENYSSQFEVPFSVSRVFPHVINIGKQIHSAIIQKLPSGCDLNFSFDKRSNTSLIEELAKFFVGLFSVVPEGLVIFFTSYAVMTSYINQWQSQKGWAEMAKKKKLFVETNRGEEEFKAMMRDYLKSFQKGAVLMGVFGGKLSEGIDFSDGMARAVVLVGVPYPNARSLEIVSKKEYITTVSKMDSCFKHVSKTGEIKEYKRQTASEWYDSEAIRATNQAVGRAIRHIGDYGSILLLDDRFHRFKPKISSWAVENLQRVVSSQQYFPMIKDFFKEAIEYINLKGYKPKPVDSRIFVQSALAGLKTRDEDEENEKAPSKKRRNWIPREQYLALREAGKLDEYYEQNGLENPAKKNYENPASNEPVWVKYANKKSQKYKGFQQDNIMQDSLAESKAKQSPINHFFKTVDLKFSTLPKTPDSIETKKTQKVKLTMEDYDPNSRKIALNPELFSNLDIQEPTKLAALEKRSPVKEAKEGNVLGTKDIEKEKTMDVEKESIGFKDLLMDPDIVGLMEKSKAEKINTADSNLSGMSAKSPSMGIIKHVHQVPIVGDSNQPKKKIKSFKDLDYLHDDDEEQKRDKENEASESNLILKSKPPPCRPHPSLEPVSPPTNPITFIKDPSSLRSALNTVSKAHLLNTIALTQTQQTQAQQAQSQQNHPQKPLQNQQNPPQNPLQNPSKTPLETLMCSVCYCCEDSFKIAKCGHILCERCWREIVRIKLVCPVCKQKVREKTLINIV